MNETIKRFKALQKVREFKEQYESSYQTCINSNYQCRLEFKKVDVKDIV